MKKTSLLTVFALLLTLFLAACASEPNENSTSENEGETTSEGRNEGGDLVIATHADAVSLDPHLTNDTPSADVRINIYENLVTQDENMENQPGLAESWEQIDDTTWEFKLRQGVTFHDGSDFNAEVVKANLDRILDPEVGSAVLFMYNAIKEVQVVDDYTVRIITEFPFAPLPAHLAHPGGQMMSKELIKEDYAAMEEGEQPGTVINAKPNGTGPFKFEERKHGQSITLVNNENYWGEPALLDSVTFKVVPEDLTRISELTTGNAHISTPLSPSDVAQVEGTDGIHVQKQESSSIGYIGFNMDKKPFDDVRVRKAISMAIDKEQIINGIYDGVGIPAQGPLAPGIFGYDKDLNGLEYNVEEAKKLLAEAGYEDGFSATIWTNDDRQRVDTATNVQAQLAEIGIDLDVEILEWGAMLDKTANGEHEMMVFGWTTVTGDADNGLYPLFHSDNVGAPGNRTFTVDKELDQYLDGARETSDQAERQELYSKAQERLVELAPFVYLLHQEYLIGVRDEVKNLTQLPTQLLQLKEVYIED
ncbi:glutathione ABC transporter substrate-binding protein [Oceanobacillus sp. Castelsardo]|uniref:glutathione ABC transporter substrate-binding protein n=1 Tax=Oceanobacillus sp. Castelsardo TaxID=1851204 RepID=UPI000838FF2A|nr:glutathione ABC transporter substrate-binding protein [Oceanobacillus sp. Castelsardo]